MTWHLDGRLVETYADGKLVGSRAASVEAHVLSCAECRRLIAPAAPEARLTAIWTMVEERVDAPRGHLWERLLVRCGLSVEDARLLSAAPSLQLSWLVSLAVVLTFAAAATHGGERGAVLFLVLAPLAPVAGVAGAYGRGIDPTYEITRSSPYPALRLVLLRVSAVLVTSIALTSLLAVTITEGWITTAWLFPSLALAGLTLVFSRWLDVVPSAGAVVFGYASLVLSVAVGEGSVRSLFEAPAQVCSLLIALGCLLLVTSISPRYASVRSK